MEDTHVVIEDCHSHFATKPNCLKKGTRTSIFCVFDGHGGTLSAEIAEKYFTEYLVDQEAFREGKMEEAIATAYAKTDRKIIETDEKRARQSGATALCAVIVDKKLYVGNIGDSEGILCRSGSGKSKVVELTFPHKAIDRDEQKRVADAGGKIIQKRVCGSLAVTRGLGDYDFKVPYVTKGHTDYVSRIPHYFEIDLDRECECLILACDGLWDVVSHKRSSEIVEKIRKKGRSPADACEALIIESLDRDTTDNVSVVVVYLDWD